MKHLSMLTAWLVIPSLAFVAAYAAVHQGNVEAAGAIASTAQTVDVSIEMPGADGTPVHLAVSGEDDLTVVCFLGCECPLAKLYAERLGQLADRYRESGVRIVGVNSNPQDSLDEIKAFVERQKVSFPIGKDQDSRVRNAFGATRTPEVFAFDSRGLVVYRGRIDDQYRPGVSQAKPGREDLKEAIEDHLANRPIRVSLTQAVGCLMSKPRELDPSCKLTYTKDIAPILQQHCVECHRPGDIGPFAISGFDDVTAWADMILETMDQGRMPPWHAEQGHRPLANERVFPDEAKKLFREWVEGGMPYGDGPEPIVAPKLAAGGWQLPHTPDLTLTVCETPFSVPAEGVVEYQYFVVDPQLTHDVWVEAAEIRPGNPAVVHHAIAFIRPPDGVNIDGIAMLAAYVPGQRIAPLRSGMAKRIPAGSKIVFQMHYTPTGKVEQDKSTLGLMLVDEKSVKHELISLINLNHDLEISPGDPSASVSATTERFPKNGLLLSIAPHMHLRGKSIRVFAHVAGEKQTLVNVPRYDFNWQHTYWLKDPIPLENVNSLGFNALFDNSESNPFNPDPTQFVTWGDQTWEEMAVVFFEVAKPIKDTRRDQSASKRSNRIKRDAPSKSARFASASASEMAGEILKDLDTNGDGVVEANETELAVKSRLFQHLDADNDRIVTRDEIESYTSSRTRSR